ncbi:MAG: hypothetical protein IT508_12790 [Burkholderiaceae bacterium]|nr:hypothetical protein [Burkholderiaceae bacterium]
MPRRVALLAALVSALLGSVDAAEARASARHRRFERAPVAVTSPLATDTLRAGETLTLAWQPLPELARHAGLEEWEAFLSFDDGARYSVRLTPHLDLERRSFAITLPQMAAPKARLLLRFGNEEEELEYELPGGFEILPARKLQPEPAALARGRGEPARLADLRDAGVTIWVEGSRSGEATRTVVAARDGAAIDAIQITGWPGFRAATSAPEPPQAAAARPSSHPFTGLFAATTIALDSEPRPASIEPRRSTCRQNE